MAPRPGLEPGTYGLTVPPSNQLAARMLIDFQVNQVLLNLLLKQPFEVLFQCFFDIKTLDIRSLSCLNEKIPASHKASGVTPGFRPERRQFLRLIGFGHQWSDFGELRCRRCVPMTATGQPYRAPHRPRAPRRHTATDCGFSQHSVGNGSFHLMARI
jgi:hypothetical protein